jgi:hypothetical protein
MSKKAADSLSDGEISELVVKISMRIVVMMMMMMTLLTQVKKSPQTIW